MTATRTPVRAGGLPVIGSTLDLRRDYLGTILRASRELGPVVRFDVGVPGLRMALYSITGPEGCERVMSDPVAYRKETRSYDEVRLTLGNGLLTSQDEDWLRQRRYVAPVFTRRRMTTSYAAVMVEEASAVARRWAGRGTVDVHAEMTRLTARVVGRVLLGSDVEAALPRIMETFAPLSTRLLRRAVSPRPIPPWLPTPANREFHRHNQVLREIVDDLVAARRRTGDDGGEDLLGLLLRGEGEERLTDAEVVDQVLVFLLAGHETTASTLACALVELARAPQWQEAARAELAELPGPPTAADLPRLPTVDAVVREALRLYPAAHSVARLSSVATEVDGYALPARANLVTSPWALHRRAELWPDPDRFDPGRFRPGSGQPLQGGKQAWLPFSAGPRACIGAQFAMLEASLVLAVLLGAYELRTALPGIPLEAGITLRPAAPLPVQLVPRG
ncbi:cytochrome P450 [Motilibacter rhizosphaerae]|uniref:Cytochrome P450 n=1 Tax=Motilibacter rhizosphaerae TaxID=598652 RepID=A0A4Q7NUR7_9ACTN|nr:cytochrome P450 [Motilibacter rhizosphaerae]RZS90951.1 cytochrome P450 [Motilibacter rhizosphaerae]